MLHDRDIIDFITRLQKSSDTEAAWKLFLHSIGELGYIEAFYGLDLTADRHEDHGLIALSNYDSDYLDAYFRHGGIDNDFNYQWIQHHDTVLHWDEQTKSPMFTRNHAIMENLSLDFRMDYGVTLPTSNPDRSIQGGVGLSATGLSSRVYQNEVLPLHRSAVMLAGIFDMYVRSKLLPNLVTGSTLGNLAAFSAQELETVKWLASGYSIKEIADTKMHRSIDSINIYIRNAKKKLNTRTRDQMIARAVLMGLI